MKIPGLPKIVTAASRYQAGPEGSDSLRTDERLSGAAEGGEAGMFESRRFRQFKETDVLGWNRPAAFNIMNPSSSRRKAIRSFSSAEN